MIVKDASRALVESMQTVAAVAIWLGIYILPMLTVFGLVIFAAWKLLGRVARRSQTAV